MAGTGSSSPYEEDGEALTCNIPNPNGLAIDPRNGDVYFGIRGRLCVLREGSVTTVAGTGVEGNSDGPALSAGIGDIEGMAIHPNTGNLYFCDGCEDEGDWRIKVLANGTVSTVAVVEGPQSVMDFALDAENGRLLVSHFHGNKLTSINLLDRSETTIVDGLAVGNISSRFKSPNCLALDSATGDIYFSASSEHRLCKLSCRSGLVSTVAGFGHEGFSDGPASDAKLGWPIGVAFDPRNGDVFFVDGGSEGNERLRVLVDGEVKTIAGTGDSGRDNGDGGEATFMGINRVVFDVEESILYVNDNTGNLIRAVQMIGGGVPSLEECRAAVAANPRSLLRTDRKGRTPLHLARFHEASDDVLQFLEERTQVALQTDELHGDKGEEVFNYWFGLWDDL